MSSITPFPTKINTPDIDTSLSKEKGRRSLFSGLAFAGCMVAGSLIGGSETVHGFGNQNLVPYRSIGTINHQRVARIDEGKHVTMVGNFLTLPNNHENGASASYNWTEKPILNYDEVAYNDGVSSNEERMGALDLVKKVAQVNTGHQEKLNWNKFVSTALSGTRPFNDKEIAMHSKVLEKRSVIKGKLYDI